VAGAGKELALAAFDRRMARAMGYRLRLLDLVLFAVVALAALTTPAAAQDRPFDAAQGAQGKRGVVWNDRPSIVFGEDINIDIKGRAQLDGRRFDPKIAEDEFDVRTLRLGLKGDLTRHFDWEIEREIDERFDEGAERGEVLGVGEGLDQALDVHPGGSSRRGAAMLKKAGSVHAIRE
jgi:hypothetical protein